MCVSRCSCSGTVKSFKGNIYADICPKGKLKNSFVTFPKLFRSVTVIKPECLSIGNVNYLTTGGTGLLNVHGKEVEGVYTLILADSGSLKDRIAFQFFTSNPSGCSVALFLSFAANVNVRTKCCNKKALADNAEQPLKIPFDLPYYGNYAKLVIFHQNGRVEEEDLINCWYYN